MDLEPLKRLVAFITPKDEKQAKALRRYLRIGGIALAVILLILIVLPLLINVNSFGRQVTIGDLSLSIFSGSVRR